VYFGIGRISSQNRPLGFGIAAVITLWQHLLSIRPSMNHGMPFITSRKLKKHLGGRTLAPF